LLTFKGIVKDSKGFGTSSFATFRDFFRNGRSERRGSEKGKNLEVRIGAVGLS